MPNISFTQEELHFLLQLIEAGLKVIIKIEKISGTKNTLARLMLDNIDRKVVRRLKPI